MMSSKLDKAMLAMNLDLDEEEDVPYVLPNQPKFSSCEYNAMSLIGRLLNPECQSMSNLILDMHRKWQIYDRVRGIALNKERFQFIFKYEQDLEEILKKYLIGYKSMR